MSTPNPNRYARPGEAAVLRESIAYDLLDLAALENRAAEAEIRYFAARAATQAAQEVEDSSRTIAAILAGRVFALKTQIAEQSALLHPIRRVPEEVLADIFCACLQSAHADLQQVEREGSAWKECDKMVQTTPFNTSLVCQSWRRAALSCPSLWSVLVYTYTSDEDDASRFFSLHANRSGNLPLHVYLRWHGVQSYVDYSVCAEIQSCFQRTAALHLRFDKHGALMAGLVSNSCPLPALRDVSVRVDGPSSSEMTDWCLPSAPSLRNIVISDILPRWDSQLVTLTAAECLIMQTNSRQMVTVKQIQRIATLMPNLQSLELQCPGMVAFGGQASDFNRFPLANLRQLYFSMDEPGHEIILPLLLLPALEELTIHRMLHPVTPFIEQLVRDPAHAVHLRKLDLGSSATDGSLGLAVAQLVGLQELIIGHGILQDDFFEALRYPATHTGSDAMPAPNLTRIKLCQGSIFLPTTDGSAFIQLVRSRMTVRPGVMPLKEIMVEDTDDAVPMQKHFRTALHDMDNLTLQFISVKHDE